MSDSGFSSLFARLYGLGKRASLDTLKLSQDFVIDEFLALLNQEEPTETGSPLFLGMRGNTKSVSRCLRSLIDEWLATGRDGNGVEDPRGRSLQKAEGLQERVWSYSRKGKISLLHDQQGLAPWIVKYPERQTGGLRNLGDPSNEDYATEHLVFFLLSDLRSKLAKCRERDCGAYFVLKHWNRQYKGGTLCNACKRSRSVESALKATAESRQDAAAELHRLAAKKFAKQIACEPEWYKSAALKVAIADYLNTKIERSDSLSAVYLSGARKGLTGKWVARADNWKAIQALLKGDV